MAVNFREALCDLLKSSKNQQIKKIKLINGEVLEGSLVAVNGDMIELLKPTQGAGQPKLTIPISSVLYISDCELP